MRTRTAPSLPLSAKTTGMSLVTHQTGGATLRTAAAASIYVQRGRYALQMHAGQSHATNEEKNENDISSFKHTLDTLRLDARALRNDVKWQQAFFLARLTTARRARTATAKTAARCVRSAGRMLWTEFDAIRLNKPME